jgi:uncharacterized protein (DUF433 family)
MKNIIEINKEILGGIPVFKGTRVPVKNLWDYLEGGESIEQFLTGFPSVRREQVIRLLKEAERLTISKKQKYENIT